MVFGTMFEDIEDMVRVHFSPDTDSAGAMIFDFPVSRTVRNECVLFTSY